MIKTLSIFVLLSYLSVTSHADDIEYNHDFSDNVVNLKKSKRLRQFKLFLGTYNIRTPFNPMPSLGVIRIDNTHLSLWQQQGRSMFSSFRLNLDQLDTEIKTPMGHEFHTIKDNIAQVIRTQVTGTSKIVQLTKLTVKNAEAKMTVTRTHYRKKYWVYGPWVLDTTSLLARHDKLDVILDFIKLSPTPLELETFIEIVSESVPINLQVQDPTLIPYEIEADSTDLARDNFTHDHPQLDDSENTFAIDFKHIYDRDLDDDFLKRVNRYENAYSSEENVINVNFGFSSRCSKYMSDY